MRQTAEEVCIYTIPNQLTSKQATQDETTNEEKETSVHHTNQEQIGQLCICELYYGYIVAMVRSMLNSRFMLSKFLLTAARLKEIKEDFNAQPLKIVAGDSRLKDLLSEYSPIEMIDISSHKTSKSGNMQLFLNNSSSQIENISILEKLYLNISGLPEENTFGKSLLFTTTHYETHDVMLQAYHRLLNDSLMISGNPRKARNWIKENPDLKLPVYKPQSKDVSPLLEACSDLATAAALLNAQDYGRVVQMLDSIEEPWEADQESAKKIAKGLALQKLSKLDEAREVFWDAAQYAEREGLLGDVSYAYLCLGEVELNDRHPDSAAEHFQKAMNGHDHPFRAGELLDIPKHSRCAMHLFLANAYKHDRKPDKARKSYQQAITEGGTADQSTSDSLTAAHINYGNLLHSLGDHTAAVPHYEKGIELSERWGDMVSHAWAHGNLGNTYLSLSQPRLAFHHLQRSFDLTLEHEPTPTAIGRADNNLGTYYQAVGDLDKAQESYDTALGHGVYGQDQAGQARAYGNIGNVYMLKKKPERAVPHYSEVLRLSRDRLTAAVAHHNRGCAYFDLGEKNIMVERRPNQYLVCGEAASEMESEHRLLCPSPEDAKHYHHALKDLEKVIVHHEETFASIKGSSSDLNLSVAWFETNAKTFLRAQDCAYGIGDHNRALVYAEQCRARTLGELLLNSKTGHHGDTFNTPLQSDSISSVVRYLKTPNVPVVVLSYTGTRLLVWVLVWDGEEVKITAFEQEPKEEMFDGKTFDNYIRYSLSEMLTGGLQLYGGLEDQTVSDESPAAKLFELIGKPLLRIIEVMGCSGSRMVLIPDSYTKLIPFSALYDSKRQCFLGDSHSIVYSPSLLTLGVMSQMPPADVHVPLDSDNMCVVGNPTTPPFKYNKEEWDLGPLPYATEEARSVAHMLQTTPLLQQEATKDAVLSKIRQAKVVHLATHGSAGGGFLVLGSSSHNFATVTKHTVEDPSPLLLLASELESLDIPAALVVLSSCDSGRGVIRGDDIQGMARSFLLAGARAVLTSLWKAPDESANFFMQYFYRYLLDGHKASEALQKTSHSIRCFAKYSNFVHWSGHQLTGQDVTVTHTLSSEDRAVHASLAIDSSTAFPRFDVLYSLTDALNNRSQTDIQLLCGPPGVDLVEPVTDLICSNCSHYSGGIVWLHSNDHTPLQELAVSSDRALVILDGYDEIPSICLNSSNIDVIIISNGLAEETRHHVKSSLNRPVSVHEVKPLSELHATQRLVYSVQSSFHLPPTAADQSAFQQLAHLTMGSPILVRMVQYLLHYNMKHSNTPSEGLLNTVQSIEDMLDDDDDVLSTSRLAVVSAVCGTLSTAAQRLLYCLSCLDGLPVPLECIETIANMIQPPGQPLITELKQAAVLLGYPSPVVIPTTVQSQSPLLYVPATVAETVWTASSLHNKALSLLLIKNAILKGPHSDTLCHQVLKSWETTMICDSQDCDSAVVLCLKEHIIELMEKRQPVKPADFFRTCMCLPLKIDIEQSPYVAFSKQAEISPLAHDDDKSFTPLAHDDDKAFNPLAQDHDRSFTPLAHDHNKPLTPLAHDHDKPLTPLARDDDKPLAHDDDKAFTPLAHDHNKSFTPLAHDYDKAFNPLAHDHDRSFTPLAHDHNKPLTPLAHDYDKAFTPLAHDHNKSFTLPVHDGEDSTYNNGTPTCGKDRSFTPPAHDGKDNTPACDNNRSAPDEGKSLTPPPRDDEDYTPACNKDRSFFPSAYDDKGNTPACDNDRSLSPPTYGDTDNTSALVNNRSFTPSSTLTCLIRMKPACLCTGADQDNGSSNIIVNLPHSCNGKAWKEILNKFFSELGGNGVGNSVIATGLMMLAIFTGKLKLSKQTVCKEGNMTNVRNYSLSSHGKSMKLLKNQLVDVNFYYQEIRTQLSSQGHRNNRLLTTFIMLQFVLSLCCCHTAARYLHYDTRNMIIKGTLLWRSA